MASLVDLHTHVLPGIDDGPSSLADSVAMAELAAHGGTRVLVATPHLRRDYPDVRPDELAGRAAELTGALAARNLPIEVRPGAEVSLEAAESLSDPLLRLATLGANGSDLLIETPYDELPKDFEERLAELSGRGFRITLAHPERNPSLQRKARRLGRLVEDLGVLVQVTGRSLRRDTASGALALYAIRRRWAHVLASDSHAVDWRPPDLNLAVQRAADVMRFARPELEWMASAAPLAIVEGRPLPERPARAPRLGLLRRG